jgi:hypothetical protein
VFRSISLKSEIIRPLPKAFVDYLNADSIYLPVNKSTKEMYADVQSDSDEDSEDEESDVDDDDDDNDKEVTAKMPSCQRFEQRLCQASMPDFPDLVKEIRLKIENLEGSVFPKLNWSSPKVHFTGVC